MILCSDDPSDVYVAVKLRCGDVVAGIAAGGRIYFPEMFALSTLDRRVRCPYCDAQSVPADSADAAERHCMECRGEGSLLIEGETIWLPTAEILAVREVTAEEADRFPLPASIRSILADLDIDSRRASA